MIDRTNQPDDQNEERGLQVRTAPHPFLRLVSSREDTSPPKPTDAGFRRVPAAPTGAGPIDEDDDPGPSAA